MLNVNPETVCFLIDKAHAFHAREDVVIDEEPNSPTDDWGLQALANQAGDPTVAEFTSTVENLEPDQQQELVALLWLGRGDISVDDWEQALSEAKDAWTPNTASYLLAHPMLSDYFVSGLEDHGYNCE